MSRIKSLGVGSNVLTGEVIDKLKASDEHAQIKPLDEKMEENTTKQKDITAISTLLSTLKTSASAIGSEGTYLKRKTDVTGKSANITASAGVNVQEFNVDVKQLAQKDVYQTTKFKSPNAMILGLDGKRATFEISVGEDKFKIEVDPTMTYEQLAQQINNKAKDKLEAKILNVGGDKPYQMILQSKNSGTDNKISIELSKSYNDINVEQDSKKLVDAIWGSKASYEMGRFNGLNETPFRAQGSFNLSVDGEKFAFDIDTDTTLESLIKKINENSNGKINAEAIKNDNGKYQLVLQSKEGKIQFDSSNTEILKTLARGSDFYITKKFNSGDSKPFKEQGSFNLSVGSKNFKIEVDENTTLNDLVKKINEKSKGVINAKTIINSTGEYQLVLDSKDGEVNFKSSSPNISKALARGGYVSYESKKIDNKDSGNLFEAPGKFNLTAGKEKIELDVDTSTTLENLAKQINEKSKGVINARVVKDSDGKFQLFLQSNNGEIEFENISSGGTVAKKFSDILGLKEKIDFGEKIQGDGQIQKAQNAEFSYNGVKMIRQSNDIDDIIQGVKIELKETGKTTAKITNDTESLAKEIEAFVKAYNDLANNLSVATDYNEKTNLSGTLQGINEITTIKSTLNKVLMKTEFLGKAIEEKDDQGRLLGKVLMPTSISDFGLSLSRDGLLTFDRAEFDKKVKDDFDNVKIFFMGTEKHSTIKHATKPISAGKLEIGSGALTINGKEIIVQTKDNSTKEQNLIALMDAINKANIQGLQVSLNDTKDGLILSKTGGMLEIGGRDSDMKKLGMEKISKEAGIDIQKGIFARLNESLEGMVGKKGSITSLSDHLTEDNKKLKKEKERTQEWINSHYATMENQFANYDTLIGRLNRQFSTLQAMINAELNKK